MHSLTETPRIDMNTRVKSAGGQMAADVGGELAILSLKTGTYYGLNEVGTRIWNLLDQPRTVREIRDYILAEYAVDASRCERDLVVLLADLARHHLVEFNHAAERAL